MDVKTAEDLYKLYSKQVIKQAVDYFEAQAKHATLDRLAKKCEEVKRL
jgi:hypothetical protein